MRQREENRKHGVYRSRSTKQPNRRRTNREVEVIRQAIRTVLEKDPPMTVRQVFYRLVSQGVIAKTEQEYKCTVVRLLTEMRLARDIPFGWIADHTRWMRKPTTFSSMESALRRTAEAYRRSVWDNQEVYVEVWLEKDALAGVLYEETGSWDVPLMVTRGYSSLSYLYEAAQVIRNVDKPTFLYYFGDYDPSGIDITANVERRLREFTPEATIHFSRVAVTEEQIQQWRLPSRPTKKTDSRSQGFAGDSVEVDSIEPGKLRELVEGCITRHVDPQAHQVLRQVEDRERQILVKLQEQISA